MNLSLWIVLPGVGKIAIALAFIVFARQRAGAWLYLGLGAVVWAVTVGVKFLVAIPVNPLVYQLLYVPDALWAPGSVLFYGYVGALTGLTEVLLTWLLLRYTRLGHAPWTEALAFGIGFGAVEALYLGLSNLATAVPALASPQSMPEAALNNLGLLNDPLYGLAPATDRLAVTLIHVFCSVLLFYGVASGQARWFWIAFTYKSLVDAVAGFAILFGSLTLLQLWVLEAVLLVLGCVAWWGIRQVQRRYIMTHMADPTIQTAPSLG